MKLGKGEIRNFTSTCCFNFALGIRIHSRAICRVGTLWLTISSLTLINSVSDNPTYTNLKFETYCDLYIAIAYGV